MNLKRARDAGTITRTALLLGYPILLLGYIIDILVNFTACSLLLLDFPRESTVSKHLSRIQQTGNSYQKFIANWIANNLLDAFDPDGNHLRK